ncbi:CoA transferase, partial [Porticoccaceae bacterium]|nr:CoA transferase [Porticoccaceae bacterium]
TADGHLILAVGNDGQFQRFCEVIHQPQLAQDSRYESNRTRVENRESLCSLISEIMKAANTKDWLHRLELRNVPCGPINTIDQVFADPQILARGMLISMVDTRGGEIPLVANPINYSRSTIDYTVPPPELGSSTESILGEYLEYSALDIAALRNKSVI